MRTHITSKHPKQQFPPQAVSWNQESARAKCKHGSKLVVTKVVAVVQLHKPLSEVDPSPDDVRLEAEPSLAVPTHPPILPKPHKIFGRSSKFASYFSVFGIIGR